MKRLLECDPTERDMASEGVERSCEIVLIKGFRDIEGKYIDYVTSLLGKKFVLVGPLVQEPIPDEKEDESSDIDEIAYGLELSKINFIWVVRFPKGANGHNGLLEKTLPRVPIHHDQPINARLVDEVGVGVEVVRDRNKRLSGERLAAVIKQVVMEDCGEVARQKAADMREKLKSKGDQEIDEVVKELVTICNNG
ncbi:UNVERIFIED_CONTAM: UDP-glucosyltransferase 29 [Sesamum latifolium]|uniref:UDP-glucosyltransferase 29 n=1 Tax=Sesamum latifolium TaxID=2727402 RepID=A0AAW2TBR8_9LAMI